MTQAIASTTLFEHGGNACAVANGGVRAQGIGVVQLQEALAEFMDFHVAAAVEVQHVENIGQVFLPCVLNVSHVEDEVPQLLGSAQHLREVNPVGLVRVELLEGVFQELHLLRSLVSQHLLLRVLVLPCLLHREVHHESGDEVHQRHRNQKKERDKVEAHEGLLNHHWPINLAKVVKAQTHEEGCHGTQQAPKVIGCNLVVFLTR
mmetsp:Transcript_8129/g.19140  ORF Transcript_8129/g.19140 Transcript_8129/m.19140 type:complete len:205 (-) Transcript_8129:289-903(-)